MSERLQIRKSNKLITDTSVPNFSKLLDKNRKPLVSRPPLVQAKLTINQPGDEYEQEADRVAEQVMRMPDPVLQRKCAKCDEDEKKVLQSNKSPGQVPITQGQEVPPVVHEVLRSPGQSLDPATRAYMEPRFGHDFSKVRVHADSKAGESAQAVNALAYTVGNRLVFAPSKYSPQASEGRKLIAHELTHVLQQNIGGFNPMIQRRLIVTSDKREDIKAMLKLLEQYSGFILKYDPKTNVVSRTSSVLKPLSPELASKLDTIMNDTKQDAEIHLGRTRMGVQFGEFPSSLREPVQEIRIDQILAVEKGAPGAGVSKLAHEIVENYEGHALLKEYNVEAATTKSHEKAVETEILIEGQLGHPGSRRKYDFRVPIKDSGGNIKYLLAIQDWGTYYLVWDASFEKKVQTFSNARRVSRVKVSSYKIEGFIAGSNTMPETSEAKITSIAADMKNNPTATALVHGYASGSGGPEKLTTLADRWTSLVMYKVIWMVGDKMNTNEYRFELVSSPTPKGNFVEITVERPNL